MMHTTPSSPPLALVVDDNNSIRFLLREVLEGAGVRVEEATNGLQALERFRQFNPDIVLLDVLMPEQNGFDTCAAIRRLSEGTHTPILFMTGLDDMQSISRGYEVGATDFITKPWEGLILSQRVRYMLRASQTLTALRLSETHLAQTAQALTASNQELTEARDRALEAARLKTEFLATVSHELLTPMNGVLGMTTLLLDTPLSPDQQDCAETIQTSGESLLALLNDLLLLTQLDSEQRPQEQVTFILSDLCATVLGSFDPEARQKGLQVTTACDPTLPRELCGPATGIETVLRKLIGNAIKFTARGSVTLRVVQEQHAAPDLVLRFEVQDTGIGIPAMHRPRLFQPLTQGDGSFTRQHGGIGVGLAIAKKLVDRMGGTIDVISEPGQGSTFWFTVPLTT
jgi:signal transduction histidine kinase